MTTASATAFLDSFLNQRRCLTLGERPYGHSLFTEEGSFRIEFWSLFAFEAVEGQLTPKSIEIAYPETGDGQLATDETVTAACADDRLQAQIDDAGGDSPSSVKYCKMKRTSLNECGSTIQPTLVPNTSCATCHSFNELVFDFHNLSFLESADITIAPW